MEALPRNIAAAIACALLSGSGLALADESNATAPAADKSGYWLFAPVPEAELRGMDTDRPNKTNTPHTIDAGHVQLEAGFFDHVHNRDRYQGADARTDALALGHVNLRVGVLDTLELNAAIDSVDFLWTKDYLAGQSTRQRGIGDIVVGGKLNLWGAEGGDEVWSTALAVQPQWKVPTARQDLGNGHNEFFFGVPFAINLPADFHLGAQTTVSRERNRGNAGDVTGWQNSLSLDRVVVGALDVYVEYWMHLSSERHVEAQHTADIGFTYPLGDNIVLDMGVNLGLNKASNTVEWLAGASVRF